MTPSARVREFIRTNIMGILALYVALAGTAYATHPGGANTISSGDIINGEVTSTDLADNTVSTSDLHNNQVRTADVRDDTLAGGGLGAQDLAADSVGASEVAADSLAGGDIDESALTIPDGSVSPNVALLDRNGQTFAGIGNTFTNGANFGGSVDVDLPAENRAFSVQATTSTQAFSFAPQFGVRLNNRTTGGNQGVAVIENDGTSTGLTEFLLQLRNDDADQTVNQGLLVSGSPITTALDVSDPDIGTALNIGANDVSMTGGTLSSEELRVLDNGISSADILNLSRSVNLPVGSFLNVTDTEAIDFSGATDNDPDFGLINGHVVIAYDDGGGANTDSDVVGASLLVPPDYTSGGEFRLRVTQSGATAAHAEGILCAISQDGLPPGASDTDVLTNTTAPQTAQVVPAGVYFAGTSVSVNCRQSAADADDGVRIHAVEFRYTASQ